MADAVIPDINSCSLGKREVDDECTKYPVVTESGSKLEVILSDVTFERSGEYIHIHSSNNEHMKAFVQLQSKLFRLINPKVRVKHESTLRNMLMLTDFNDDGRGYIKLVVNDSCVIDDTHKSIKLVCNGFTINKKQIFVTWAATSFAQEDDDELIVIVNDDSHAKETFRAEFDAEMDSMMQIHQGSQQLIGVLEKISKMIDTEDFELDAVQEYMKEYYETKQALFE